MAIDNQLNAFEAKYRPQINQFLKLHLNADISQPRLADSMAYSINAGGKRLRPLLTIAVLKTLEVPLDQDRLKAVCAVELLHTYSLIHDDLPAMDDDDLRRGKPTNHVQFGAGMATLAGDGLLTLAFQWLTDNALSSDIKVALVNELSKMAGPAGMVAGQADDIQFENHKLSLAQLQKLHRHKTGDLINYAVMAGSLLADNDNGQDYLMQFGRSFGLAFQIYDDILDVTSSAAKLGKPVQQDEHKNTYPNLMGLDQSYQALSDTIKIGQDALTNLKVKLNLNPSLLASFFSYFQFNGAN